MNRRAFFRLSAGGVLVPAAMTHLGVAASDEIIVGPGQGQGLPKATLVAMHTGVDAEQALWFAVDGFSVVGEDGASVRWVAPLGQSITAGRKDGDGVALVLTTQRGRIITELLRVEG